MFNYQPQIQNIAQNNTQTLDVLRLDLIDPVISGNKWFKLKHNIAQAQIQNHNTVLTFGGAHSNHLAAAAKVCKDLNIKCIAVIRGETPKHLSDTLIQAQQNGMLLHFVSREDYNKKSDAIFIEKLKEKFGAFYLIPEGGNNKEGILGCMEILKPEWQYDYIICACGTGATFSGLLASAKPNEMVIGLSVLKGENKMPAEVEANLNGIFKNKNFIIKGNEVLDLPEINNHCIINAYAFSGYAKYDQKLVDFKKTFEAQQHLELDYVYTNKLFFGVYDLIAQNKLKPHSKILVIHSGGLQGNKAFEERFLK